ncbi:MAG: hypothetical protein IPM64_17145 [Phycisphaerales bacterium]|nr:hypothetical protein [Phycisphaerales bacterium]
MNVDRDGKRVQRSAGVTTAKRPFVPDELRGVIDWQALARATGRDPKHVVRIVAVMIAVIVVLMVTQPGVWKSLVRYCERQRDAWRESEVRTMLSEKYGVRPDAIDRTE